ncbi:MAG: hypothetical protein ACKVZ0_11420 [Gemmatimonadales bacterium]
MAGWVFALGAGESPPTAGRDGLAYLFCAAVVAFLVLQSRGERLLVDATAWLVAAAAVVIGGLLVLGVVSGGSIGSVEVWYHGARFRGWATNPNQLALLIAPLPWLALAVRPVGAWRRRLQRASAVALFGLGIATRSDALLVAWAVAAVSLTIWLVVSRAALPTKSLRRAAVARLVVPLSLLLAGIVAGPAATRWAEGRIVAAYGEGGQGSDRIARFGFGLDAVAASPVVGFGPGSFAGATGAFGGHEAHNTPIDWAASTGMVGLAALALACLWVLARCIRARSPMATLAVVVLLLFMELHYVLRQPIAWFYLLAAAAVAEFYGRTKSGMSSHGIERPT